MARTSSPTKRLNFGKNHGYQLDGKKLTGRGVTTLIGAGIPKPALKWWAGNTVAACALDEEDLWRPIFEQKGREAAYEYLGTEVHRLAERYAAGEEIGVDDETEGYVDAYISFREDWHPTEEIIEGVVVSRTYRYMGTFDSIAVLAGWNNDGTSARVLYDIKTGKDVWPEAAIQMAAYRRAESYLPDPAGGEEEPMPQVDACAVLHLRSDGTYSLRPVIAGAREFALFLAAEEIAGFMGSDKNPGWSAELLLDEVLPPQQGEAQ